MLIDFVETAVGSVGYGPLLWALPVTLWFLRQSNDIEGPRRPLNNCDGFASLRFKPAMALCLCASVVLRSAGDRVQTIS